MASQQGVTTRLGLTATPARGPLPDDVAPGVRTWSQNYSYLGLSGVSFAGYGSFLGRIADTNISRTDTWSLTWTEGDITAPTIDTYDTWSLSWNEVSDVGRFTDRSDAWLINWVESASIVSSGVTNIAGTDTYSITWTESPAAANITISPVDTWSITWTESATAATTANTLLLTDTWNVAWNETGSPTVLGPSIPRDTGDTWAVSWTEAGARSDVFPTYPSKIEISFKTAKISVRFK